MNRPPSTRPAPLPSAAVVLAIGALGLGGTACSSPSPAPMVDTAWLEVLQPGPVGPADDTKISVMSGHLTGVPVPQGAVARSAVFSPDAATVVLKTPACGARVEAAYAAVKTPVTHTCTEETLTLTASGDVREDWNPWKVDDWHVGPFDALPELDPGPTFKPHRLTFEEGKATALLTPRNPGRFVDLMGGALGNADWAVRPRPDGTNRFLKGSLQLQIEQDGAQVTILLVPRE